MSSLFGIGAGSASTGFYPETIDQSLRFEDGDSANLSKNFSASNRKTNTLSFWVKRGNLSSSQIPVSGGAGSSQNDHWLRFLSDDTLEFRNITSNSYNVQVNTNRVFRDTTNWYHIMLVLDTSQGTSSNRVKMYVNGEQATLTFSITPSVNADLAVNYAGNLYIGRLSYSAQQYFDGYIAELNFIDGQALEPEAFGQTKNGIWIPDEYSVKVSQIAQNTGTAIGDMPELGGLAGAFNGTKFNAYASSAGKYTTTTAYIGKNWGSSKTITGFILYSPTQYGFGGSGASTFTVKLYGSNSSPSNGTDGTLLYTSSSVNDNLVGSNDQRGAIRYFVDTKIQSEETISNFTTTAFSYHWVLITLNTTESIHVGQIEFYEDVSSNYYGTNGFRLTFADSSSLGDDTSGNGNDFTSSGLASSDVVLDSPTNNFATLNVLQTSNNASTFYFSEGNLALNVTNNSGYRNCSATFSPMGIKGYFEFCVTTGTPNFYIGVIEDTTYPTNMDYADTSHNYTALVHNSGVYQNAVIPSQGNKIVRGGSTYLPHNIGTISAGDVLGMAFDFTGTNRRIWFHRANTYGTSSSGVGNPSTGANPVQSETYLNSTSDYRFKFSANTGGGLQTIIFNFGQDGTFNGTKTAQGNTDTNGNGNFFYEPPTDFIALCSASLSDTTLSPNQLENASDYFNTKLWTGTGASADAKTGVGFQPDWLWAKDRNYANHHILIDSSRGVTKYLQSSLTNAEATDSNILQSFDADGFTTVGQGINYLNVSDYVGWNWRCGGTTPTKTYKVVVVSDSGNKYRFRNSSDSATFPQSGVTLNLQEGGTYVFDWSDSSAQGHPFRFSTTSDGTHGGGSEYTTGVVKDDSAYTTTITVASSAPQLYFYCSIHSGMGGSANTNSTFGSTNFDGDVLSITQNNSNSGFSIATFTGSSASSSTFTVGHGLGSTPKMIIAKQRNLASGWSVYHHKIDSSSPEGYYILLNSSGARVSSSTGWGNTAPTSTVFSTYTTGFWGTSAEIVAYCFDEVEGHSKLGSYIGNGSSSGQYINIGFRVAFIMFKRTNSADNWWIHDNKRNTFNPTINYLSANTNNVEYSNLSEVVDFTSNGVKIRTTTTALNANGSTYIYMAFGDGNTAKFGNSR